MTKARRGIWVKDPLTEIRLRVNPAPKPPVPSAFVFIITMIIAVMVAMTLERAGLGFKAGFAFGVAFMLLAALVINSSARQ